MKRILSMIVVLAVLLGMVGVTGIAVYADDLLIAVGGKRVTADMTLDDVKALFGQPQLATSSFFGGQACTFYGEGYSDYLFIETFADDTIASYGSVGEGFETAAYRYGDVMDNYVRRGYEFTDREDRLCGVIRYAGDSRGYLDVWFEDRVANSRSLVHHAIEMWNAVSYLYGSHTPATFNETAFYVDMQLGDNGSNLYDYCETTRQGTYYRLVTRGMTWGYWMEQGYYYPNPLMFAEQAAHYSCMTGYDAAFSCSRNSDGDIITEIGFVSPLLFEERTAVEYTDEEKARLHEVRTLYAESVRVFNEGASEGYYITEPQYETLPLTAGEIHEKVVVGSIDFLNAVRAGAGLPLLVNDPTLTEAAQCKAVLTVYMSANDIACADPHNPPQPEGVDDALYARSQLGSSENLFMCGYTSGNLVGSFIYALDDSYGVGQYYARGHRYNLLDPHWQYIGVGQVGVQGVHKLGGYQTAEDIEVVAWPSKGIMLEEVGFTAGEMFTCQFYNGYRPNDNTVVTVTCLNSGDSWTIDRDTLTDDQAFWTSGIQISYMDSTIPIAVGNVYEITFDHLTDASGNDVSYSYRSVFESAYGEALTEPAALTLDSNGETMAVGDIVKLTAAITPADADNKMVRWESSDPTVANVNENGFVTAHRAGEAIITAVTEAGGVTAACTVQVVEKGSGDVNGDGTVDLSDALRLFQYINGKLTLDDEALARADVAKNYGSVELADAIRVFFYINGKQSEL